MKYVYSIFLLGLVALNITSVNVVFADTYEEAVFWPNQKLSQLNNEDQYFDVAWPKTDDKNKKFPLIIWLPGSGWYAPVPKSTFARPEMEDLAKQGYVVVSMNYRKSNIAASRNKNLFPAAIQDVRCAVRRFRSDRYPNLPIDKNQIFVAGESAGGNIALMMASLSQLTRSELQKFGVTFDSSRCEFNNISPDIQGAISMAGPTDLVSNTERFLQRSPAIYVRPIDVVGSFDRINSVPAINMTATPDPTSSSSMKLVWSTERARKCEKFGNWQGDAELSDSVRLDIKTNETFGIRCSGQGGSSSRTVTAMTIHTSLNYLGVQPNKNPRLAIAASPYRHLLSKSPAKTPPILVIHAVNDEVVPVQEARKLVKDVLEKRKFNHAYIELTTGGHGVQVWKSDELTNAITSFIDATLEKRPFVASVVEKSNPITLVSGATTSRLTKDISILRPFANDSVEVMLLQNFLNRHEQERLVVDGKYKTEDLEAVKRFQSKYRAEVLDVWGINEPTGFVGFATRSKINDLINSSKEVN